MRRCSGYGARTPRHSEFRLLQEAASVGGLLKFSDELLGCELSVRLGRVVVWRHDATKTTDRQRSVNLLRRYARWREYIVPEVPRGKQTPSAVVERPSDGAARTCISGVAPSR
jgi:hypothetical protein